MPMNAEYRGPGDLPEVIPVFPLPGALLLPRGQLPLNIFEPRMIQPDEAHAGDQQNPHLYKVGCAGRITQIAETGDGRYVLQLTGVARFRVREELAGETAYRRCKVSFETFLDDFVARKGEEAVDRDGLLKALSAFLDANDLNEALVNALAMMSPYGSAEKQALLEAPDLKTRAEVLVALTEIELAKTESSDETPLQ